MDINSKIQSFKNKLNSSLSPVDNMKDLKLEEYEQKTCDDIKEILSVGGVLIDVRSPAEFNGNKIHHAINIPLMHINSEIYIRQWPKTLPIFIYSNRGIQANVAKEKFISEGYENVHNIGKINFYPECL